MALTATCFTYAVLPTNAQASRGPDPRAMGRIENKDRVVRIRAQLNNASNGNSYPTSGGIPLSTTQTDWGMIRNLDYVQFVGVGGASVAYSASAAPGPAWHYNPETHSMIGFTSPTALASTAWGLGELSTAWTPTISAIPTTFFFVAHGW